MKETLVHNDVFILGNMYTPPLVEYIAMSNIKENMILYYKTSIFFPVLILWFLVEGTLVIQSWAARKF
jgi:hypothetical protein